VLDSCKGVILLTAHWQADQPHIFSGANSELYCDYLDEHLKDLSKEAWEITYPAKGHPELAKRIKERFDAADYSAVLDDKRGWNHVTCVTMILLRPDGDLPCIQLSIPQTENTTGDCFKYGKILAAFHDGGYCILGSGSSYHNFEAIIPSIMGVPGAPPIPYNRPFEGELERVATKVKGREEEKGSASLERNFS
jgi:aromatic ring-opening dioxygenase catalytic subunit (LigB family)